MEIYLDALAVVLTFSSSWHDEMITSEISDFADFKGYIKANPDSDAAEMIHSAPLKRKAFKALEDDEVDESDRGSTDSDGGNGGGDGGNNDDGNGDGSDGDRGGDDENEGASAECSG